MSRYALGTASFPATASLFLPPLSTIGLPLPSTVWVKVTLYSPAGKPVFLPSPPIENLPVLSAIVMPANRGSTLGSVGRNRTVARPAGTPSTATVPLTGYRRTSEEHPQASRVNRPERISRRFIELNIRCPALGVREAQPYRIDSVVSVSTA